MKIVFTGDTSFTGDFSNKIQKSERIFSPEVYDILKSADYVVSNLEGPAYDSKNIFSFDTKISSPKKAIEFLSDNNIKVFNLSNNHIFDFGVEGYNETISQITINDCSFFGSGSSVKEACTPLVLKNEDISVALFGISDSNSELDNSDLRLVDLDDFKILKDQIKEIKNSVTYIVVNFHGGEEFTMIPSPTKRRLLRRFAKIDGVDIVIAHHSHTYQGFETYYDKYIFYSLGNFVFDIPNHDLYPFTKESELLIVDFNKEKLTFFLKPIIIKEGLVALNKISIDRYQKYINYRLSWMKESYRVVFREVKKKGVVINEEERGELQNRNIFSLLITKSFYSKFIKVMFSDNYRSLYINAVLYKVFKKIRTIVNKI